MKNIEINRRQWNDTNKLLYALFYDILSEIECLRYMRQYLCVMKNHNMHHQAVT